MKVISILKKVNERREKEVRKVFELCGFVRNLDEKLKGMLVSMEKSFPDLEKDVVKKEFVFLLIKRAAMLSEGSLCSEEEMLHRWRAYTRMASRKR